MGAQSAAGEAGDAYRYLPESTQSFKTAAELKQLIEAAGFDAVRFKLFMFGAMAVHWAVKPEAAGAED